MDLNEIHVGWIVRDGTDDAKEKFKKAANEIKAHDGANGIYTIDIKLEDTDKEVKVEFSKKLLENPETVISTVEQAASDFIGHVFKAAEEAGLDIQKIEVLGLTFTNGEDDPIKALAQEILGGTDVNVVSDFLKGDNPINKKLDIKITLSDNVSFTLNNVNSIFSMSNNE